MIVYKWFVGRELSTLFVGSAWRHQLRPAILILEPASSTDFQQAEFLLAVCLFQMVKICGLKQLEDCYIACITAEEKTSVFLLPASS